ncbi:sigma factor-like helix-turn-helix DNA-binding protein [Nocardia abscessus]|uniref:sigma factor-like helix-turn-helix DNA-binding protein n=1 Tax=Nocardia abscessus TaxID=120957 RepID=UPI0027DFC7E3|nr:sigma factor-like helix-turn-helix DNA-binding protein [Nocardia abscessus]
MLQDVFGMSGPEVADVVGRTPAAVRQLASRARKHVEKARRASRPRPTSRRKWCLPSRWPGVPAISARCWRTRFEREPHRRRRRQGARDPAAGARRRTGGQAAARLVPRAVRRGRLGPRGAGQRPARAGGLRRHPHGRLLLHRRRRPHRGDRRGPQPGQAARPAHQRRAGLVPGRGPRRAGVVTPRRRAAANTRARPRLRPTAAARRPR